jgi:hypothetical protein
VAAGEGGRRACAGAPCSPSSSHEPGVEELRARRRRSRRGGGDELEMAPSHPSRGLRVGIGPGASTAAWGPPRSGGTP